MSDNVISIKEIQQFLYCPHRWGLIKIGKVWAENIYVTKANLLHDRVHNFNSYPSRGKKIFTNVSVYNDLLEYNLYGIPDCIELTESKDGVNIIDGCKKYNVCIVEYKPTKSKYKDYNHEDLMQVFAQKICADFIFKCDCEGIIYYANVKKRIRLPLKENFEIYNTELKNQLEQMRYFIKIGKIPSIRKNQNCNGCSLKEICMPKMKKIYGVRDTIRKSIETEDI